MDNLEEAVIGRKARNVIYREMEEAVADVHARFGRLPAPAVAREIWHRIWQLEAHNSTALEGNTLAIDEVRVLLDEGRTAGGREFREYSEVLAYSQAAEWVYRQGLGGNEWVGGELLSLFEVRRVHTMTVEAVWLHSPVGPSSSHDLPGAWRQRDIHQFHGGMQPPPWTHVEHLMADWVRDVNGLRSVTDQPFVEALAALHARFEQIHPFIDGNGRTGRLLNNLILVRCGYPPALIFKRDRAKYLRALQRADEGDYGSLGELLARAIKVNVNQFIVPAIGESSTLMSLESLATAMDDFSANALRNAAQRGRLRAVKDDKGKLLSTHEWVAAYRDSRWRGDSPPS